MGNWFEVMLTITGPEPEVDAYVRRRFPDPQGPYSRYSGQCARRADGLAVYVWTTTLGGPDLRSDSGLFPKLALEMIDVEPNTFLRWRRWEDGYLRGHIQPSSSVAKHRGDYDSWFDAFDEMLRVQGVERDRKVLDALRVRST